MTQAQGPRFRPIHSFHLDCGDVQVPVKKVHELSRESKTEDNNIVGCSERGKINRGRCTSPAQAGKLVIEINGNDNRQLSQWYDQCVTTYGEAVDCNANSKNGSLYFLDQNNNPVGEVRFEGAFPVKQKCGEVDAGGSGFQTEVYEFSLESFKQEM